MESVQRGCDYHTMTPRQGVFHEGWMMGAKKGVRCYGVEVSVMAWSSIVTECQCHTLIRPRLVYDGLSRVCVRRELCWWKSEQGWWCWHVVELVVIVQKPSQTPMSFYRDVIPHNSSHNHMAGTSQHCVQCHTMHLFTLWVASATVRLEQRLLHLWCQRHSRYVLLLETYGWRTLWSVTKTCWWNPTVLCWNHDTTKHIELFIQKVTRKQRKTKHKQDNKKFLNSKEM